MDSPKWSRVREQIEAIRNKRDENTVGVACKVGVLMGSFLERNYPRGVAYLVDTNTNRIRLLMDVEIDLQSGDIVANCAMQPPAFIEKATQTASQCSPTFQR